MFSLHGKTALITGSGRGIGFAISKALAKQGANIILSDVNQDLLEEASKNLAEEFPDIDVFSVLMNVGDDENVKAGMDYIAGLGKGLDILVNNAGINILTPVSESNDAQWERIMDINVLGIVRVSRAAFPLLKEGGGKVINLCSIMSEIARPTNAPYSTTKGAARQLTRALAIEWAEHNIQVNGIAPGYVDTEMIIPLTQNEDLHQYIMRRTPAKRWGKVEEIGAVAVFLASEEVSYITGQMIFIDGGLTISL